MSIYDKPMINIAKRIRNAAETNDIRMDRAVETGRDETKFKSVTLNADEVAALDVFISSTQADSESADSDLELELEELRSANNALQKKVGRENVWAGICIAIALGGVASSVGTGLHGYKLGQELEHERVRTYLTDSHDKCWANVENAKAGGNKEIAERIALTCLGKFNVIFGYPAANHHDRGY